MMHERADAISGIAGKLTVASGAGGAALSISYGEYILAIIPAAIAVASFILDWHYKRKSKELEKREQDIQAQLQREKNEREYELQQTRLQIQREQFAQIEARKERETQARIAAMQSGLAPIAPPPDTGITPLQ